MSPPVRNVYYMLAYAFEVLNENGYKDVATEKFDNVAELLSEILIRGVRAQIKRGLRREYTEETEPLSAIRGKIEIGESVRTQAMYRQRLVCTYDVFSVDSYPNRIIKTTMEVLLHADISKERKKVLKKLLVYFGDIGTLDVRSINWHIRYDRNSQTYRMLVSVCYLVIEGLLQTRTDGTTRLMDFLDEQRMCRLYERFVLEYYRREFPALGASASQIPWSLDDGVDAMLPVMQSDITLSKGSDVLIIDTKYYGHTMQEYNGACNVHSANLYQVFTYVKNKDAGFRDKPHTVSGMLLYARTEEDVQPDETYRMSGNRIDVTTLDLNQDFEGIKRKLDGIAEEFFGVRKDMA